jgi:hypothetical protein
MTEKKQVNTVEEAKILLRKNSNKKELEQLARTLDEQTLQLLVSVAIGLSWEDKNSAFSTFALTNKKEI